MTIALPVPATALLLRPWQSDDLPALLAAHRDPVLRRRLAAPLTGDAEARRWLDAQATGWARATRFSFAVVADDRSPLGHVVVKVGSGGTAEVGYWTAAHARGRGIASRAVDTLSQWALDVQDMVALTRLDLIHAVDNHPSCRVAVRCGYVLHELLPASPPAFPTEGHRHVRG
ncbi:Protein N-acetyltransferase, RimJ/RimL family [Lentzea waywayandensis]|uniref:Protein N-acetyltransferase, RimJ/RimL family n=1 Tax=Lentzea waywayandensis TaxID=84724 RepID=A0A1I6F613_9PSEU|nr:GNAT family N-acetyltransferase [Lentzea waywayandensis]SFR25398.1 Protein N-acetyltransferase, RimJ/RimL family [Lentzea waywayandensis]